MTSCEQSAKLLRATIKSIGCLVDDFVVEDHIEVIDFLAHREYALAAETLLDIASSKNIQNDCLEQLVIALNEAQKNSN